MDNPSNSNQDPKSLGDILANPSEVIDSKPDPERQHRVERRRLEVEADEHARRRDDHLEDVATEGLTEPLREATLDAIQVTEDTIADLKAVPEDPTQSSST